MSDLLTCTNLTKNYGNKVALNDVNLNLPAGKIIGLLGPNGSGKTTFIKLVTGLLKPNYGEILIDGQNPSYDTKKIVSYLPDRSFLNSWMKVEQIVSMFEEFYEDFRSDLAYSMLEKLEISKDDKLKTLSKGNKEKVCLILIMSRNAKLYILDEPIAGVDPATRDYIISTIINNYNPDASVLISTHLISDVESILDEVVFIKEGHIELCDSVDSIREQRGMSIDELFREMYRW